MQLMARRPPMTILSQSRLTRSCGRLRLGAGGSVWASRPAACPSPPLSAEGPHPPPASTRFVSRALAVFAQADFEKRQQHGATEPGRYQDDGEDLARHSADERGAQPAGDDERERGPKGEDARAGGYGPKVHAPEQWVESAKVAYEHRPDAVVWKPPRIACRPGPGALVWSAHQSPLAAANTIAAERVSRLKRRVACSAI
jgi:hypothetical protein